MNIFDQSLLVAGREITVRVRDKTFLIGTLVFLFIAAAVTILPALLAGDPSTVAVTQPAAATTLRAAGLDVRTVADAEVAERLVRSGDVDAAVVAGDGPTRLKLLAMDDAPSDVTRALSTGPPVELLDPAAVSPLLRYLVPIVFGMIFFFTSFAFGLQIAQSVTEEKQSRIVEILVAAVPVRALLAGKVIAGGALAMGQITLTCVVALAGMRLGGSGQLLGLLGPAIGWFIPFFVVGFLLLASMWAVSGALAGRQEDIGAASTPVQMLIMVPFLAVTFLHDNPTAMVVMSYLPVSSPMAMPLRTFTGDAAAWEPWLALVILLASAAGFIAVAARLYEGSLMRTNGRTSMATAWRQRDSVVPR